MIAKNANRAMGWSLLTIGCGHKSKEKYSQMIPGKTFTILLALSSIAGCATVPPGGFVFDTPLQPQQAGAILSQCFTSKPPVLNGVGNGIGAAYSYDKSLDMAKLEIFNIQFGERTGTGSFWGGLLNHDVVVFPSGSGGRVEVQGQAGVAPMSNTFKLVQKLLSGEVKCPT
ncbi:hypothetical protein [Variovorax sp. HJSM1_2]|uniref:hypothetical protein n=1 Tax=Variovorax sp. HJSM1_2 TaxID=3366263 RepID=UPI003BE6194A